jgi:hypothetical protein
MDFSFIKLPKGIQTRTPYDSELEYFKKNPNVAGMAADDNRVILNPYSNRKPEEYQSVAINESARILMRQKPEYKPDFELTPQQKSFLDTTTYRNASEDDRKSTIAARILSGDPSAGIPSNEQALFTSELRRALGLD